MAHEIELAAEQVLGAGVIPRNEGMFDPISLPSGLDTRDYLRISQQGLADSRSRQNLVSSAMQDRLKQDEAFRQLEASRREQSALQELYKLETSDPDFGEKYDMYTELAAYSPRVAGALQAKQNKYNAENTALNSVATELARKRASDEEIDASLEVAKGLLKSRGPNSSMFLRWKTGLVRDAAKKEQEEKLEFQKSRTAEAAAINKYNTGLSTLQADVSSKLKTLGGLPDSWRMGDLIGIAFPEETEEETVITKDNIEDYYLGEKANAIADEVLKRGISVPGTFVKRAPNVEKSFLKSSELSDYTNEALALSGSSEDAFVTAGVFDNFVFPPGKDEGEKNPDYKKYWKKEAGSKEVELTEAGERYKLNKESILKDVHSKLNQIRSIPIDIRKHFQSSRLAQQKLREEMIRRASLVQTGLETSSPDEKQEKTNAFIKDAFDKKSANQK